ncbi:unnamed protein product [Prorocentrum cordatum]|uniref:Uncharacterized protein n=1 Tax=Prorocentrum cordatum TaxID=2364126 RepID=A0ABN9VZE5_9DINO|nr:unnamed protein product [Polarella glacialis]
MILARRGRVSVPLCGGSAMRPESDACHAWPTSATWRKPAALAAPVQLSYLTSFTTELLTALTLWVGISRATLVAPPVSMPEPLSAPSLLNPEAPSFQMPEASPGPVFVEIEVQKRTVSFDVEKCTAVPIDSGASREIAAELKQRISDIAHQHCPAILGQLDTLFGKYTGQEDLLYLKVCKKFGVHPTPIRHGVNRPPD